MRLDIDDIKGINSECCERGLLVCRPLMALPLLTLAVVASPGIGHLVALAAATVASKETRKGNKVRLKLSGDKQAQNQRGESEYGRRAAIFA